MASKKIKILFIIDGLGRGGAERLLLSTLQYMDRERFAAAVVYLSGAGELAYLFRKAAAVVSGPLVKSPKDALRATLRIVRQIKSFGSDIVHTHLYYSDLYGRIAARIAGAPAVVSTLHHQAYTFEDSARLAFRFRKFSDGLTGRMINDLFFAVSEAAKLSFQKSLGFQNIKVMHNAIDTGLFVPRAQEASALRARMGIGPDERVVLNVGRLDSGKGQAYLIEAFKSLSAQYPDLKLLIAGSGGEENRLKGMVAASGLEERVRFLGSVDEIEKIYRLADIFVSSSLHEGFGIAVIEAMASGLPVVSTAVGGVNEIIEDKINGLMVQPRDAEGIARAVKAVLDDRELARRLSAQARQAAVERFDIKKRVKQEQGFYLGLCEGAGIKLDG